MPPGVKQLFFVLVMRVSSLGLAGLSTEEAQPKCEASGIELAVNFYIGSYTSVKGRITRGHGACTNLKDNLIACSMMAHVYYRERQLCHASFSLGI
jgi:hypothetical protein